MKIYNKFVESKKEPSNKNDIWFDGSSWKMYKEGVWRSFTLPIELAKDIEDAVKNLDLGSYLKKTDVDSTLSETSTNPVANRVITERLNNIKVDTPDWNANLGEKGYIKGRSHLINGAHAIPFEQWDKRFDEDGNAIYFRTLPSDNYSGCLIREGGWQEENYTFFGTEWKSLFPAVSADIRVNYDSEVGDSVLEIKLYRESDPESFFATFINNALFAYGQCEDFIYPITKEFIPNTIARQESVDELRDETTALWENLDHGTFPNLVAGDLAGRGESVPAEFGFRASGGKSIKDGRAYIKRIKGNSVVWNQLLSNSTIPVTSNTTRALNEGTRIVVGHKYLLLADFGGGNSYASVSLFARVSGESKVIVGLANNENKTYKFFTAEMGGVSNGTGSAEEGNIWQYFYFESTTESITNTRLIDLTKAFPNDWQNINTIEDFQSRVATLGVDMNAYNEGEVIHCNTESIKSVGDNAWDEEWENGRFNTNTGTANTASGIRTKNPIKVLPNTEYYCNYDNAPIFGLFYDADGQLIQGVDGSNNFMNIRKAKFTTPANAVSMTFYVVDITTYNHDIMITLVHSGWKQDTDAGYQPYWEDTLPLPIIRKYFPQGMKSAGTAHDEIRYNKASGKWEAVQRIGSVDMGTLEWQYIESASVGKVFTGSRISAVNIANRVLHICAKYTPMKAATIYADLDIDKIITIEDGFQVRVRDSAYTDAATFKASLQGVMLYYELAEPIVTELDAEDQNFRDYYNVADFGTEMSQSEAPSAPFSADIIYQFNAVDMIREHEIEITELQKVIATMQAQLASLTSNF